MLKRQFPSCPSHCKIILGKQKPIGGLLIMRKMTINEVNERLSSINPNIRVMDDFYKTRGIKNPRPVRHYHVKCLIDGHEWESIDSNIYKRGCPVCGEKSRREKKRTSLETVQSKCEELGFEVLTKNYKNRTSELILSTKEGYKISTTFAVIHMGCTPDVFSYHNKFTIDNIKLWLKLNNLPYELISKEYQNTHSLLIFNCPIHGEFLKSWANLQSGQGCGYCGNENIPGGFNPKLAEKNKEQWTNEDATIYIIKCYNSNEEFYKIGITTYTVKERFEGDSKLPYQHEVIGELKTNLYKAIHLEEKLHDMHSSHLYKPKIVFGGYTECFDKLNIEAIKELAS